MQFDLDMGITDTYEKRYLDSNRIMELNVQRNIRNQDFTEFNPDDIQNHLDSIKTSTTSTNVRSSDTMDTTEMSLDISGGAAGTNSTIDSTNESQDTATELNVMIILISVGALAVCCILWFCIAYLRGKQTEQKAKQERCEQQKDFDQIQNKKAAYEEDSNQNERRDNSDDLLRGSKKLRLQGLDLQQSGLNTPEVLSFRDKKNELKVQALCDAKAGIHTKTFELKELSDKGGEKSSFKIIGIDDN